MNTDLILVTGADGFFGRHFVSRLGGSTDIFLHCGLEESVQQYNSEGFGNVFCGDLAAGEPSFWGLPESRIGTVVHLAGLPGGKESDLVRANVAVTKNLLSWARLHGVKRVVFASTAALYGNTCDESATETHDCNPQSPYAISKADAEELFQEFASGGPAAVASLRIPHAYGPGKNIGVLAAIVKHALAGTAVMLDGDGDEKRDFIYIDDVVSAMVAAVESELPMGFHAYNIGYGNSLSLREACRVVGDAVGRDVEIGLTGRPAGKPHCINLDVSRALAELGWRPNIDLAEGVGLMLSQASGTD